MEVDPGRNLLCFCVWGGLCMHTHRNRDNKVCVQGQTYRCVCVCTCVRACMHACVCVCVCMHLCVGGSVHTYRHACVCMLLMLLQSLTQTRLSLWSAQNAKKMGKQLTTPISQQLGSKDVNRRYPTRSPQACLSNRTEQIWIRSSRNGEGNLYSLSICSQDVQQK